MLPRRYTGQDCSIAQALEVVGDRWTLLIVREVFLRNRRFEDIQRRLGIARNVLTDRLGRLVDDDVLARRRYQERPERFEYRLTERGVALWPVLFELMHWGDGTRSVEERPMVIYHRGCDGEAGPRRICTSCGALLEAHDCEPVPAGAERHFAPAAA